MIRTDYDGTEVELDLTGHEPTGEFRWQTVQGTPVYSKVLQQKMVAGSSVEWADVPAFET